MSIHTSYTAGGPGNAADGPPEAPRTHRPDHGPSTGPGAPGPGGAGAYGVAGGHVRGDHSAAGAPKDYLTAALLSILVGMFGADRFYLGKTGTAILKLVTLGGFGLWWLIDVALVLLDQTRDVHGRALRGYEENKTVAFVVAGIVAVLGLLNGGWMPFFWF